MDVSDIMKARLGGLAGHFAISWSVIHWRLWLWVWSGDHEASERIARIQENLGTEHWCGKLLLGPLLLAGIFAFALWPLNQFFSALSEEVGKCAKSKGHGYGLLTMKQSAELRDLVESLKGEAATACALHTSDLRIEMDHATQIISHAGGAITAEELVRRLGGGTGARVAVRILLSRGRLRYVSGAGQSGYGFRDEFIHVTPS